MQTTEDLGPNSHLIGVAGAQSRLTTPALIIDLAALDRNLARHRALTTRFGLSMRPHVKSHKCSQIAHRQIKTGAIGVSAASLREAETMAAGGITDILITSPVVGAAKIERLSRLLRTGPRLTIVVDNKENLSSIAAAARSSGKTLGILVDVDLGMGRTGVAGTNAILQLAKLVRDEEGVAYRGLQAYSGIVQHIENFAERDGNYRAELRNLSETIGRLQDAGLSPEIVSGGGTGTLPIDCREQILTEHQAGSYLFMDVEYGAIEPGPSEYAGGFETSLLLHSTVVSNNVIGRATIDAGLKSFATDGPRPQLFFGAPAGTTYEFFGDEHGRLTLPIKAERLSLGSIVQFVTPHCDPTVNLHNYYHVVENDTLVDIWKIDARGVL